MKNSWSSKNKKLTKKIKKYKKPQQQRSKIKLNCSNKLHCSVKNFSFVSLNWTNTNKKSDHLPSKLRKLKMKIAN